MKKIFSQFKGKRKADYEEEFESPQEEYVELDTDSGFESDSKIIVRPYTINDFSDVKDILDSVRDGYTIALLNIKPLKDKDLVELKRAINKLKKTCEAIDGDIAGFGEDYLVVTPSFASIYRGKQTKNLDD